MTDWQRYEDLLAGEVCISLINEPIDYEVEALTALEKAKGRWRKAKVIEGEKLLGMEGAKHEPD